MAHCAAAETRAQIVTTGFDAARVNFDLPLRCRCGHVRGVAREVAPSSGLRFVCYCKDCQAFARFLAHVPENACPGCDTGWEPDFRQGYAPPKRPDVLDAAGGTDIFQMAPGRVTLTEGTDALRCLSFSGKVLRWYAACCRTPIANTAASPRFPMVALIHCFMDQAFMNDLAGGRSRDEVLGPPVCRIYERSAAAPLPPNAPPPLSLGVLATRASKILGWWMRGLGRPNPFFDDRTQAPLAVPRVLAPGNPADL
jgi:hypothetical protein